MKKLNLNLIKSLSISVLLSIVLSSCDDKTIDELNSKPIIEIFQNDQNIIILEDSIKVSLKSNRKKETYRLIVTDKENNLDRIEFETLTGNIIVEFNGAKVTSIPYQGKNYDITLTPVELGTNVMKAIAYDNAGRSNSVEFKLTAFTNLNPIADLEIKENPKIGIQNHYLISGENSRDKDETKGGGIVLYEFNINGLKIETIENSIPQILSRGTTHSIQLRVKDSDGEYSLIKEKKITL